MQYDANWCEQPSTSMCELPLQVSAAMTAREQHAKSVAWRGRPFSFLLLFFVTSSTVIKNVDSITVVFSIPMVARIRH
jgi:hypothetical protein